MTQGAIDKAHVALASARLLPDAGDADDASSRAYYAMFDAAVAALAWAGIGPAGNPAHKSHAGLVGGFGQHLVLTGLLPADFGRSLNRVQELRLTTDDLSLPVPLDKAKWAVQDADTFVAGVRELLTRQAPG